MTVRHESKEAPARPVVPDYAGPASGPRASAVPYLAIANCCGALPLVVGCGVFSLWLLTGYHGLEQLGALTILVGVILFFVGAICLVADVSQAQAGVSRPGRNWKRARAAALLLANFPVAVAIVGAAANIQSRVTVVVQNAGTTTIDSFVVAAPGVSREVGPIPPGASRRTRFTASTDGSVDFTMVRGNTKSTGTAIGYVTKGAGGSGTVVVNGSSVTVK